MNELILLLILAIIVGVIIYFITVRKRSSDSDAPIEYIVTTYSEEHPSKPSSEHIQKSINQLTEYPYAKKMLLTKAEYSFYNILKRKCDEKNLLICPKIRMEDFLNVTDKKNLMKYRGYIRSRHIDFMICDNKLRLLAGLELDDNSHLNKDVADIDRFKDKVFEAIDMPLFRVKMSQGAYETQLDNIMNNIISNQRT
ncbi:MAG: DUF2726 domain-containing protein [Roseburia sp.]|nr:DUF2726 domain-containing protein [Roseburia sp.]